MPVYKIYNGKPVVGYTASELGYTDPILTEDENDPNKMFWSYQNPDGSRGKPLGLQGVNDMLGSMGYKEAKEIRKQSFASRMAENLVAGGGIGESFKKTLSEKSKARMMGIKEAFDPLNIAKKLTGGSRLGPALLGKMMGRSQQDLEYFAGDPKKRKLSSLATTGLDSESLQASTESLGRIYELLKQDRDNKVEERNRKKSFEESLEEQEEQRNQELIKALTARRKKTPKEKRKEEVKQKNEERKAKADNKKTENKEKVEQKKTEAKKEPEAKKTEGESKKTAEKAKKEEVKQTADKQKTEAKQKKVEEAPKAEPKPTAAPAPKPTEVVKPSTAAKIGAIAAVTATGVFSSSDAFSKTLYPYAEKASKGLGGKVPPVAILGQWFGESGGGKNLPSDFNYAGIKAGKNDKKGDYVLTEERYTDSQIKQAEASGETLHKVLGPNDKIRKKGRDVTIDEWFGKGSYDKALSEGKKWVQVKSYFAKFNDFEDFTNRYISFLSSPRYAKARAATTAAEFGSEVAKAGYATASADKYSAKVASFAESFNASGTQIDRASTENKNLKEETGKDKSPIIVNNNTTTVQKQASAPKSAPVDDKPAYMKKVQQ